MNTVLSVVVPAYNEAKTIASKLKRVLAQLSHDLAASRPFDDFDGNAVGTLSLLQATRRSCVTSLLSICRPISSMGTSQTRFA